MYEHTPLYRDNVFPFNQKYMYTCRDKKKLYVQNRLKTCLLHIFRIFQLHIAFPCLQRCCKSINKNKKLNIEEISQTTAVNNSIELNNVKNEC